MVLDLLLKKNILGRRILEKHLKEKHLGSKILGCRIIGYRILRCGSGTVRVSGRQSQSCTIRLQRVLMRGPTTLNGRCSLAPCRQWMKPGRKAGAEADSEVT